MQTKLLYMDNMQLTETTATVQNHLSTETQQALILDQTIFYPQGGGQPYDQGQIISSSGIFQVQSVRNLDGQVHHYGEGIIPNLNETVTLKIDQPRRLHLSMLHTAGHLIDSALNNLGLTWTDSKGHHFPDGPYVSYENLTPLTENLNTIIETEVNNLIQKGQEIQTLYITQSELSTHCFKGNLLQTEKLLSNLNQKPLRVVKVSGNLGYPCSGTHINNINQLPKIQIPPIKSKKQQTRIRYNLTTN